MTTNYENIFQIKNLILSFKQYLLVYIIYIFITCFHELGHGIVCKFFGGKVGKIGVAFIIFNPAMYCDISAVREFKEKYKQVLSSAAGFGVNGSFVGLFSILDYIYPSNFFKILIILNVTSIIINAIPFVRLDGYWILSFITGIHNLYNKSIRKLFHLKEITQYKSWKDYFLLSYGIMNGIILCYCTVRFVAGTVSFVMQWL